MREISLQEALAEMEISKEELYAAFFTNATIPTAKVKPTIPARLFLTKREWEEIKRACKEAAGWRCQYVFPNGRRCANYEGKEISNGYITVNGKRVKHKRLMHMNACHQDPDPQNPNPRMLCMCPSHHTRHDREEERLAGYTGPGRKGYQITTTDALLAEITGSGITIREESDGYHWSIDNTEETGRSGKATAAVSTGIRFLCWQRDTIKQQANQLAQELSKAQTTLSYLQPARPEREAVIITSFRETWNNGFGWIYRFDDEELDEDYAILQLLPGTGKAPGFYFMTRLRVDEAEMSALVLINPSGDRDGFTFPGQPTETLEAAQAMLPLPTPTGTRS